jgi:hypothetical protein
MDNALISASTTLISANIGVNADAWFGTGGRNNKKGRTGARQARDQRHPDPGQAISSKTTTRRQCGQRIFMMFARSPAAGLPAG